MSTERLRACCEELVTRATHEPARARDPEWLAAVQAALDQARAAWPNFELDLVQFCAHLGTLIATRPEPSALSELCVEDLFLALACANHDPLALRAFEREYLSDFKRALARLRVPRERHDDAKQQVWQKLFVAEKRPPKILEYSGRGRLKYWFRVMVVRSMLDDLRGKRGKLEQAVPESSLDIAVENVDPEIEHLKRLYSHEFRTTFEEAVGALSPEERNVLRAYYVKEMTVDEIATGFGIHRATAARRVTRARDNLLADTRRRLGERLRLDARELDSLLRLIESRLHASVQRLLA